MYARGLITEMDSMSDSLRKGFFIWGKREKISRGAWRSPEQRERNKVVMIKAVCNRGKEMQENMGWTNHAD